MPRWCPTSGCSASALLTVPKWTGSKNVQDFIEHMQEFIYVNLVAIWLPFIRLFNGHTVPEGEELCMPHVAGHTQNVAFRYS